MVHKNIFICGFMGAGKSTHGKKLANKLKKDFIDLDYYIEEKEGLSVSDIFNQKGEQHFRRLEFKYLKEIAKDNSGAVVSLGGGAICFHNVLDFTKKNGYVIYIKLSVKSLVKRVTESKKERPLIRDKSQNELTQFVSDLLAKREVFYNQADVIVHGENLTTARIVKALSLLKDSASKN